MKNRNHKKIVYPYCNDFNTFTGDRVKVVESIEYHFFDNGELFCVTDTKRNEEQKLMLRGGFFNAWILAEKCYIVEPKK